MCITFGWHLNQKKVIFIFINFDKFLLKSDYFLVQWWTTQIGLWAAFEKIAKNFVISGFITRKTEGKSSKYRKITGFQFEIGP
jgi:hypothetical protein